MQFDCSSGVQGATAHGQRPNDEVTLVHGADVSTAGLHFGSHSFHNTSSLFVVDEATVGGEVTSVVVVFASLLGDSTSQERQVVGTLDLDASDLIQALATLERTRIVAEVPVKDVAVNLGDQSVILPGVEDRTATTLGQILLIKDGSSFKEAINQSLSIVLLTNTETDDRATGLRTRTSSDGVSFTRSKCDGAEDLLIVGFGQGMTDFLCDFTQVALPISKEGGLYHHPLGVSDANDVLHGTLPEPSSL